MKLNLKRHAYTSNWEKVKHYLGGLLGWVLSGSLLFLIPIFLEINTDLEIADLVWWIPVIVFVGWLVYTTATKYWIAIGLITNVLINLAVFERHFSEDLESAVFYAIIPFPAIFLLLALFGYQ